ncbi:hypothetical protein ECC02_003113 [Trypanosoma cruzi]|uniref:Uncharacterized protein n=1 Tax=Trypanosoma cruzi TaxID=5693 RepID=A0A7J6YBF9_TRYCR|nr:hypothetical protein ECC02_003113 [Trypanosoma cruzi]
MASVADSAALLIPQLLAENARLKTKIGIPDNERVLQSVLQGQMQRFFDDARRTLENVMSNAVVLGSKAEKEGKEENEGETQRVSALVETLRVLGAQNEEMVQKLSEMQTQCVAGLNGKLEVLTCERDTLRQRVLQLEEELAAASAEATETGEQPPSLLAELRYLRASDALLRQQVEELRQRSEASTEEANKNVREGLHDTLKLPRLLEHLGEMRTRLDQVETERELFRLQMEESQKRGGVWHALREAQLEEKVALGQSTIQNLLTRVAAVEAREAEAQATAETHKETIARLENTIQSLQTKHTSSDEALASKRRRVEKEILDNPNSVRRELITFWQEGSDELRQLREEVEELREKERVLRTTQEKLTRMERTRSTVTNKLVTLAEEIGRVREENQSLRAQCVGLEVERDYLRSSLASAISHHMQEEELQHCSAAIRDAAVKAAAASLSVVADPQAIQQAMRQLQELKNEVAQLTKQREKIHRYITLHEERITALITREALLENEVTQTCNSVADNGSVLQRVKRAEMQAFDLLTGLAEEASVHTEGGMRRRETFLGMEQRITEYEQQLETYQEKLSKVIKERDDAKKQFEELQAEMRSTLTARETAMTETLNSNAALMNSTESLRLENQQLRASYNVSVLFSEKLSTALAGLLELLRAEMSFAASLNNMLTELRAEIVQLTRRSANAWNTHEGEVQEVVEAVKRMCGYILQAVEQQQRGHTLDETVHIRHLMETLKKQEQRLKETQEMFTHACQELGEGLAQRITAALQSADVMWKKHTATLLEERQHLQAQLGTEKDLLARIEQSMAAPANTNTTTSATTTTTTTTTTTVDTGVKAAEESHASHHQVLDAINQFLAISSQEVAEKVGEEEQVEEEGGEYGDPSRGFSGAVVSVTDDTGDIKAAEEEGEEGEEDVTQSSSGQR